MGDEDRGIMGEELKCGGSKRGQRFLMDREGGDWGIFDA